MEPKLSFAFALAHCGCSYKLRTAGESKRVVAPRNTKGCTQQPKSTPLLPPQPQLPVLSCCPRGAPEPGAGCTKPFSCPHPPLGFWKKTCPCPGAPEDAGLGCDEDLGCRALQPLLCGCILCSSSSPAPQALLAGGRSGRCRFGEQRGAGSCGWGRAGWSCDRSQGWSEWIPLNRALCLGGLGARGAATAPGQGNRQRLIPGTSTDGDADTDTLCPQSQAVAAP